MSPPPPDVAAAAFSPVAVVRPILQLSAGRVSPIYLSFSESRAPSLRIAQK
jgi:hypothetical protein